MDRAVVSVGGSVGVWGEKPSGKPWYVALRDPDSEGSLGEISIPSGFLSTSGSYEKQFTQDGVTYHHLLDPDTGYPADTGLLSVTVWSDSGVLSDALSTACFVMGMEDSQPLLEEFAQGAIFITEDHHLCHRKPKRPVHPQRGRLHPGRGTVRRPWRKNGFSPL